MGTEVGTKSICSVNFAGEISHSEVFSVALNAYARMCLITNGVAAIERHLPGIGAKYRSMVQTRWITLWFVLFLVFSPFRWRGGHDGEVVVPPLVRVHLFQFVGSVCVEGEVRWGGRDGFGDTGQADRGLQRGARSGRNGSDAIQVLLTGLALRYSEEVTESNGIAL